MLNKKSGIIRYFILFLLRLYKKILSPHFGNQCRFYPTCSEYSYLTFLYYPFHKAIYHTGKRIIRCNPYNEGGIDIPPQLNEGEIDNDLKDMRD